MAGNAELLPNINSEQISGQISGQLPDFQEEFDTPEGELHLRFFVPSGNEFVLPAIGIREVLEYSPDRINPMPNVSPLLLGTINVRGRVVWVGDLGQFLGDTTLVNTDRSEISIIAIEDRGLMLGLAIDSIGVMTWLDPDKVKLCRNCPDSMAPFIKGEWQLNSDDVSDGTTLKLLDQANILQSARWVS
jgi:purine-binding chemotaxis protein CheW